MRLPAVALAAVMAVVPVRSDPRRASTPSQSSAAAGALNRYAAGQYEAALSGLIAVPDIRAYVRPFQEGGPAWIAAASDPDDRSRRRLIVASVILEISHARLQEDWVDLRGLVEWACALLRAEAPGPAEQLWQRAALAVVEGAYDWRFLTTAPLPQRGETADPNLFGHAAHVRERFPDDGRFALAGAMILEAAAPREPLFVPAPPPPQLRRLGLAGESALTLRARARAAAAIDGYTALVDDTTVGAEANLRIGYLRYRQGDPSGALDAFARTAGAAGDDVWVQYLAHYFTGRIREREGARAAAEAAYRRALDTMPGAQSSALALAALLFQDGRPGAAYTVVEAAAAVDPAPVDPWRTYGYGDLRFWPELVVRLREQVRR